MSHISSILEPEYAAILKARFCKQYMPSLKEFLSDFDISETLTDDKQACNSLKMHFLLDKYDDIKQKDEGKRKKQIKKLKENCKWHIKNVTDEELLLAIEEFFFITEKTDKINEAKNNNSQVLDEKNTISGKRNKLLENLFKYGFKGDEQSSIADTTMFAIAEYFGIKKEIQDLGKLFETYECIAYALKEKNPEESGVWQFHNALRLFSCVRNGVVHPDFQYDGEKLTRYHEFIIFTYIGYVLACRRIWKAFNYEPILSAMLKYNKEKDEIERAKTLTLFEFPKESKKDFSLPAETVEIRIEKGHRNIKINSKDEDGKVIKVNRFNDDDNHYFIKVCKYKKFTIHITCDDSTVPLVIEDELDYNSWFFCYKVILPDNWTPSSIEYENLSKGTQKLISVVANSVNQTIREEIKNAIQHELAALQPLFQLAKDGTKDQEELDNSLNEILVQLKNVGNTTDDTKNQIEQIHLQIGGLHKRFLGRLDEFSDSFYDLKEKNKIIVEKVDTLIEFAKQNRKFIWTATSVIGLGFVCCILFNFDSLQSPILSSFKILVIIILIVSSYCLYRQSKPLRFIKGKLTRFIALGLIVLFSWFGLKCAIDTGREFFVNHCYDFAEKDPERNQEVANLMESILESNPNDEETRMKLTRYYLDYANDAEKAFIIASPMLDDIEKHPRGILAIIEALYSQGKDFWKVRDLLESYKKTNDCDSNVVNRIEGIMNVWGQGQTSNINKGFSLLRLSADNGDIEAQYYLGYALSHEMTDWEKSKLSGHVETSEFDLITSIEYLRKAAIYKPKAALELGRLYADLNVRDSAEVYLNKARLHSSGELYKESLYRLGLLYEGTDEGNQFIKKAAFLDYVPAILYKANKEDDHKSAIELYNSLDGYHGYRYILPIAFHHLALGQRNKALKALQDGRPFGKFDMNFIVGIDSIIHSYDEAQQAKSQADSLLKEHWNLLAKKDSTAAMKYIMESAKQGCLYAEMICVFRDAERNGTSDRQAFRLTEIGEEIPFAYVLLSYLAHKEERFMSFGFPFSDYYANQAIGKGHPAGRLMLDVPSYYLDFIQKSISNKGVAAYQYNIRQRALRINKNKRLNIIYSYKTEKILTDNKLDSKSYNFWDFVSRANNVDLQELNFDPVVFPEISDIELLNEFSDIIIDNQQENPFIN